MAARKDDRNGDPGLKPGPMDTPMTRGIAAPLKVAPDRVARAMLRGVEKKRRIIYAPGIWLFIMGLIRLLPEPVFERTKL